MGVLLKCPFCGGEATKRKDMPTEGLMAVCCENKGCEVKPYVVKMTFDEAEEAWNKREVPS